MSLTKINADVMDMGDAYAFTGDVSGAGSLIQVVNVQSGAVSTITTVLPYDDTIPQKTEGGEVMTLAVTPTSASNKLLIQVTVFFTFSLGGGYQMSAAIFQDSTAGALAVNSIVGDYSTHGKCITFSHYMTAGTTNATTFKVRVGPPSSGTLTFNGSGGARKFGGVNASSITITEISA